MPGQSGRSGSEKLLESLTEEERQKVRSAVAAVWGDPAVMKARKKMADAGEELKVALRDAVEREDPEVREILKRMLSHGAENGGLRFGPGFRGKPLDPEDRKIMDEARAKAQELDVVVAAREKRENAETVAEQFEASREFQEIIYKEMVKIDPRVEKILARRVRGAGERMRPGPGGPNKGDGSKGSGKRPKPEQEEKEKSVEGADSN